MSAALAAQQQAFIAALFANGADAAEASRGWRAYRMNAAATAQRALAAAYPVVASLLGEDNFGALAREFWRSHPPRRGDIALWGEDLAARIEAIPELARAEPYLADVARVEWRLHTAATAADGAPDLASLALLTQADLAHVTLELAPGTAVVASPHPVASIVLAHAEGTPSLEHAGERLRAGVAETALVWRRGLKPCVRLAFDGEAAFVGALQEHRSLADSLQAAPALDVAAWLPFAVESQLLAGVRARADNEPRRTLS
jgi:hypothetical protein